MDAAAAHAHCVDNRHAAGRDVIAVAHATGGTPVDRQPQISTALLNKTEQLFRACINGFWRATETAMQMRADLMFSFDLNDNFLDLLMREDFKFGTMWAQIDTQHGVVGHDVVRAATLYLCRIYR